MSIRAIAWAFAQKCPSPLAKLVLIKLCDCANDDNECWPSQSRVAADCGLPRETVNRQIKALESAGLLIANKQVSDKGQSVSRYFIRCDAGSHPPVTQDHTPCDPPSHPPVTPRHTEPSYRTVKEPSVSDETAQSDPIKELWDRGVAVLGGNRALVGKMRKLYGNEVMKAAIIACERERPSDPVPFFIRACEARGKPAEKLSPGTKLWMGAMEAAREWNIEHGNRGAGFESAQPLLDGGRSGGFPQAAD